VEPVKRLRGIAAPLCVVTGALIALTAAMGRVLIDPERLAELSDDPAVVINGVVALVASLLLVFALIALYERQGDGGGSLRAVAFMVALAGTVLLAGDFWFEAFAVPHLADVAPASLDADSWWRVAGRCRGDVHPVRGRLVALWDHELSGCVAATGAGDPGHRGGRGGCSAGKPWQDRLRHRARLARALPEAPYS